MKTCISALCAFTADYPDIKTSFLMQISVAGLQLCFKGKKTAFESFVSSISHLANPCHRVGWIRSEDHPSHPYAARHEPVYLTVMGPIQELNQGRRLQYAMSRCALFPKYVSHVEVYNPPSPCAINRSCHIPPNPHTGPAQEEILRNCTILGACE